MRTEARSQSNPRLWRTAFLLTVTGLVLFSVFRISSAARTDPQQDAIRLENRLSQVEQRLYALESNMRTIEQQSRSSVGSRNVGAEEISLLSSQMQVLQNRLTEAECGLMKLDERTLPQDVRNARRRAATAAADPCRTNVDTPLRLSN